MARVVFNVLLSMHPNMERKDDDGGKAARHDLELFIAVVRVKVAPACVLLSNADLKNSCPDAVAHASAANNHAAARVQQHSCCDTTRAGIA